MAHKVLIFKQWSLSEMFASAALQICSNNFFLYIRLILETRKLFDMYYIRVTWLFNINMLLQVIRRVLNSSDYLKI